MLKQKGDVFMTECNKLCNECKNSGSHMRHDKLTRNLKSRLNRIEGQVKGVKTMIENDKYCDDILIQISAIQSAMSSVSKLLLENHIRTCVARKLSAGDHSIVDELIKTIGRLS